MIPVQFARMIESMHGALGRTWLAQLPATLQACAAQWELVIDPPFDNLSYNYAAPAHLADGTPVVVKACAPTGEYALEAGALAHFQGRGSVRLVAADAARQVMLLERLQPGTMLSTVSSDDDAVAHAAGVMRALWYPAPSNHPFPTVADWGQGFSRLRQQYDGGTGPFPAQLVDRAESLFAALLASAGSPVVLHGDLHQYNILSDTAHGWAAIDPKGVVGEPAYEVGAFLRNCLPEPLPNAAAARLTARRLTLFAEALQIDRGRLRDWSLAQAVLSAWWAVEDHTEGWEAMIALAEILARL